MPILETRNLSKIYPGAEPAVALNGVNLGLEKGEHVAIVGGGASRKSTLLHMLGGVEKPIEGKAIIQDVDIAALKERYVCNKFRVNSQRYLYQPHVNS